MADLVVRRWQRYGKDRLYVSTSDGVRVGWRDQQTGVVTVESPAHAAELEAVLAAWNAVAPAPETGEVGTHPSEPETSAWFDLARNRPGEAARARAEFEWAQSQTRHRVGSRVARALDMKTDERAWRIGAGGEETVGAKLEKLGKHGWHVLHSVPVGSRGSDIDHVVIGPGGVFTINTKTHPGKKIWVSPVQVRVDGRPQPYLRNSRFEAERASNLLTAAVGFPVFARPVLVFLTGSFFPDVTIKKQPDDVVILNRLDIPRAFKRAPLCLQPEQVAVVFEAARRSTTWH